MRRLAILVLALFLVACASDPERSTNDVDVGWGDTARRVTISGVDCIVINGYQSVAVSCDWSTS